MSSGRIRSAMMLLSLVMLVASLASGQHTFTSDRLAYPFAHSNAHYGYVPASVWWYGASVTIFAFDDATAVSVIDLSTGFVLGEETLNRWEAFDQTIEQGTAFKIVSSKPVGTLLSTKGVDGFPGMSFVPSRENRGREFVFHFPGTSPGWGQPYMDCINIFAWEDALVTVTDVVTNSVYWEGELNAGYYQRLTPPESRYVVTGTGVLTIQLLSLCDASSFVLDRSQTGCGNEFMFHVLSPGREHGRHSFYEVHAFDDVDITVYHMNNPSVPIPFDEFHMEAGGHTVKIFDYYNDVFKLESTGRVTVMAGSFQTCVGGVHGPQSIGDMFTSVPSLEGEGRRFSLGLHCANSAYSGSGFVLIATEDDTEIEIGTSSYELDMDQWVWISQPDTGVFYYDISSDKPIMVQTGSIGGDSDFDNTMTFLCGFGEKTETCEPVEPPQMLSQGYWRRQCKHDAHEDICSYVDSIHSLANHFDAFDCDSVCDLMRVDPPENDMCRKARRQFLALLLNLASGRLAVCNCLEEGGEVGDIVSELDSILSGPLDHATCVYAKTLADDLNNGRGIVPCEGSFAPTPVRAVQPISCVATPNPFSCRTTISYKVSECPEMAVKIYDRIGRLVRVLVDTEEEPGLYRVEWDGLSETGSRLPAGIYFANISAGRKRQTKTLVLLSD